MQQSLQVTPEHRSVLQACLSQFESMKDTVPISEAVFVLDSGEELAQLQKHGILEPIEEKFRFSSQGRLLLLDLVLQNEVVPNPENFRRLGEIHHQNGIADGRREILGHSRFQGIGDICE